MLDEAAEKFTPDNREKVAALSHFQPDGLLISRGEIRAKRRKFNESILNINSSMHALSQTIATATAQEAQAILNNADSVGELDWNRFAIGWWRLVRRLVLGQSARNDRAITGELRILRSAGNWSYLHPHRPVLRYRFLDHIDYYVEKGEQGSLASLVKQESASQEVDPAGQIPHWLFAFDAAGIATFRSLALLATHAEQNDLARQRIGQLDLSVPHVLPYLRACVLESVRLWPTTPLILRDSIAETSWLGETIPFKSTFLIYTPYFHRDDKTLPYANRFCPEIWLDNTVESNPALLPFSAGPARCPGENLVLFTTSMVLAHLLKARQYQLTSPCRPDPRKPLPYTINHFALRFSLS